MAEEKVQIDKKIIQELFKLAELSPPKELSDEALFECLLKLKNLINSDSDAAQNFGDNGRETNNILVVDDIGIVTYQLKVLLKKIGYNVHVAKDIFGALNSFANNKYDYIIMDLFVSTEQEGYTLLHETKKIITKNELKTKIIVITASNKAENKVKCLNGGADIYLKKDTGWQDKLIDMVENNTTNTVLEEAE